MNDPIDSITTQTKHLECSVDPSNKDCPTQNSYELGLIAFVISDCKFNSNILKSSLIKFWNCKKEVYPNDLKQNTVAFVFEDSWDFNKVITNSPWTFRGSLVNIKQWPVSLAWQEVILHKIELWVQVSNLPVCLVNDSTAADIGNRLGKFIKADISNPSHRWRKVLRIRVEIDSSKPLLDEVTLLSKERGVISTEIRYEKVEEICFQCGRLGHKIISCEFDREKTLNPKDCRFGPWLKVEAFPTPRPKFRRELNQSSELFAEIQAQKNALVADSVNLTELALGQKTELTSLGGKIGAESLGQDCDTLIENSFLPYPTVESSSAETPLQFKDHHSNPSNPTLPGTIFTTTRTKSTNQISSILTPENPQSFSFIGSISLEPITLEYHNPNPYCLEPNPRKRKEISLNLGYLGKRPKFDYLSLNSDPSRVFITPQTNVSSNFTHKPVRRFSSKISIEELEAEVDFESDSHQNQGGQASQP